MSGNLGRGSATIDAVRPYVERGQASRRIAFRFPWSTNFLHVLSFCGGVFRVCGREIYYRVRSFTFAQGVYFRCEVAFVGRVVFDGNVLIHVEVEMRCGVRVHYDAVDEDPRGVFTFFVIDRFCQRPSVAVGGASCLDKGRVTVFLFRRDCLAVRLDFRGRVCGRFAILYCGFLGFIFVEDLGYRGRLQEHVGVAKGLRFKLDVGVLGVRGSSVARCFRRAIGVLEIRV